MNAPTIIHETYGEVTRAQLTAYRKHKVSVDDHDDLEALYGRGAHEAITAAVRRYCRGGVFHVRDMWQDNLVADRAEQAFERRMS